MSRAVVVAILAAAAPARADPPDDLLARPIVLDRYQVDARLTVEIDTYHNEVGKPTSLAPDIWFGVASRWTVGLTSSFASLDRFETGSTFCVVTIQINPGDACARAYRGNILDARYLAYDRGEWSIAPRARFIDERDTDPDTGMVLPYRPALTFGALARWHRGRIAVWADPYVQIGLAHRANGNADALMVPFFVGVQPTRRWLVWSEVAYYSTLDEGNDPINGWNGIFAIGTTVHAAWGLDVGAAFGWQDLFGPQNNGNANGIFVTLGWRT